MRLGSFAQVHPNPKKPSALQQLLSQDRSSKLFLGSIICKLL